MNRLSRLFVVLCSGLVLAASPVTTLADGQVLEDLYHQAQELKRSNKPDKARELFESIAEQDSEGSWGKLAEDELRYGLPLFEADMLIIRLGKSSRDPGQQDSYKRQAETLYRQILEDNSDKPDRVAAIQHRLDQLAITKTYMNAARDAQLRASLSPLRILMRVYYADYGKWPDKNWLREQLTQALSRARYPKDKLEIEEYFTDASKFSLKLVDTSTSRTLVMEGDPDNVTIEEEESL